MIACSVSRLGVRRLSLIGRLCQPQARAAAFLPPRHCSPRPKLLLRIVVGMMSESVTWCRRDGATTLDHFVRLLSNITLLAAHAFANGAWMVPEPMHPALALPEPEPAAPPPGSGQDVRLPGEGARRTLVQATQYYPSSGVMWRRPCSSTGRAHNDAQILPTDSTGWPCRRIDVGDGRVVTGKSRFLR
jgi:hypothetical protein